MKEIIFEQKKVFVDNIPTGNIAGYCIGKSFGKHNGIVVAVNNHPYATKYGVLSNTHLSVGFIMEAHSYGDYLKKLEEKYPNTYRFFWFDSKDKMLEFFNKKED